MSTFNVPVVPVRALEPIRKADRIELAVVGDYRAIVRKGSVQVGDLVAYVPEGAIVPEWLMRQQGLWSEESGKGVMHGELGNRVGVQRMRGVMSEGLVVALHPQDQWMIRLGDGTMVPVTQGQDVGPLLEVTKWRPEIPKEMQGKLVDASGHTLRFDVENRKAWPDVFQEGEDVGYTEKVHGVFCVIAAIPGLGLPGLFRGGDVMVGSKDLYGQGLVFANVPENEGNIYVQALRMLDVQVSAIMDTAWFRTGTPIHVMGELFGLGVQRRFDYGLGQVGNPRLGFRVFDIHVGSKARGHYMDLDAKRELASTLGFQNVDLLYRGPHSLMEMARHRDGDTVTGKGAHIREGIVIVPAMERRDPGLGRVILKEVSPHYLGTTDGSELS